MANYYGCMYTRPRHIFPEKDRGPGTESTAKPHFMDDLLAAAGAHNVEFPLKTACCGGAHTLSDSDISTRLVLNILRAAEAAGRWLAPGGHVLVSVPIRLDSPTYEDPSVVTPEERRRLFGERDHVRYYGRDLAARLAAAGFRVALDRADSIPEHVRERHGLRTDEHVFHCRRPVSRAEESAQLPRTARSGGRAVESALPFV